MTKDETRIKDWRSTGRRKARRELYNSLVPYVCVGWTDYEAELYYPCGKTAIEPPKDAPKWFDDIWPTENRVLSSQLQADHETKDLKNNVLSALNWRCPSCHRHQDQQTDKGQAQPHVEQSQIEEGFGFEIEEGELFNMDTDDGPFFSLE